MEDTRGKILGIVPMMTYNTNINKTILELVRKTFHNIPILMEIKHAAGMKEASHQRIPLSLYAEHTPKAGGVAKQLADLTLEIVERIDSLESKKGV